MHRPALSSITFALALAGCATSFVAGAQAAPAVNGEGVLSIDEYLLALERIAPAARAGAEAYRDAYRRQCRHALAVRELRRLVAEGSGDPVLMAMISAAHRHDQSELVRLGASIPCKQMD